MSKILAHGSFTANGIPDQSQVTTQAWIGMNNFEFEDRHMLEIGIVTGIPDEMEIILSDFGGQEDYVIDNTTPFDERKYKFIVAHNNCSIALKVKNGITAGGAFSAAYFYTITSI